MQKPRGQNSLCSKDIRLWIYHGTYIDMQYILIHMLTLCYMYMYVDLLVEILGNFIFQNPSQL